MSKNVGVDVGTMWMVSALDNKDSIEINKVRNMYVEIDPNAISAEELKNAKLDFIRQVDDGEEKFHIISEDCFRFCQIFGYEPTRPMSQGVISNKNIDAMDILASMIKNIVNPNMKNKGLVVYSVPAPSVDVDIPPVIYHERVFGKIFNDLGFKSKPLNEAMAVVYANCSETDYSGIAISFGSGLSNIAVSYKGIGRILFSISRGGDWIDRSVSESTGVSIPRVTSFKEKKLNLLGEVEFKNKNEKRLSEGLIYYYEILIKYALDNIVKQFNKESGNLMVDDEIPIIISGGTSMPTGFIDLFKNVYDKYNNFPYAISDIRYAENQLDAVALGCLINANWTNSNSDEKGKE